MGNNYKDQTLPELRELIWERGLVDQRWKLNYIRKNEAVSLLERYATSAEVPDTYIKVLEERRVRHRTSVRRSRKNRKLAFGVKLTKDELRRRAQNKAPQLKYKGKRVIEEGFVSYMGSTRAKMAVVFEDDVGTEILLTTTEAQKLVAYGLKAPKQAFTNYANKKRHRTTLNDVFNQSN